MNGEMNRCFFSVARTEINKTMLIIIINFIRIDKRNWALKSDKSNKT